MNSPENATPTDGLQARRVALAVLRAIIEKKQLFDEAFDRQSTTLSSRDRAFVQMLILTFLRHRGQVEALLARYCERVPKGDAGWVLALGITQLLLLRMPEHAVVNTSVELVKEGKSARAAGLVNAVLRKIIREKPTLPTLDATTHLPRWLWERWQQPQAIAEACQQQPMLDICVKQTPKHWAKLWGGQVLPHGVVRLAPTDVTALEGFAEGAFWVQDAAAALPVFLLPDLHNKRVLDVCAAPGGKTAQLAARGAKVTALDRSAPRMQRLRENMARLSFDVEVVVADALGYTPAEPFPVVVLDAPCSATGTLRRHPELPYVKSQFDVTQLAALQRALLDRAVTWVAPDGLLLYGTCSLQPEEGEEQIAAFLRRHPDWQRVTLTLLEGLESAVTPAGDIRILPTHWQAWGGMDGFFISLLQRKSVAVEL